MDEAMMQLWGWTLEREVWRSLGGAVLVILFGFLVWTLLARGLKQARRRLEAALTAAQQNEDWNEISVARKRITALRLVNNGARYAGVVVALLLMLAQFGVAINGLLLPAGFLGAALGLGAQNVVRDFISGMFLLFEGQFGVGDAVTINGVTGVVEEVGVRVTRLRDDSGQIFFIPNGSITSVARLSRRGVPLIVSVPLLQAIDEAKLNEIETVLREALENLNGVFDNSAAHLQRLGVTHFVPQNALGDPLKPDSTVETAPAPTPASEQETPVAETSPTDSSTAATPDAETPASTEAIAFARWMWQVNPLRATLWREKAPPQLMAALRQAGLNDQVGAIEIFAAPINTK